MFGIVQRIKAWIFAEASTASECFLRRAKTVYEDECMKLETHYNVIHKAIKNTTPYVFFAGLGKVTSSFRHTHLRTIKKPEMVPSRVEISSRYALPDMGKLYAQASADYEKRRAAKQSLQQKKELKERLQLAEDTKLRATFERRRGKYQGD